MGHRAETRQFGQIEYSETDTICFPCGLPAFEEERAFVLLQEPDTGPVFFLQSLSTPDLCFLVVPTLLVNPGYVLSILPEDLALLGLPQDRQPEIGAAVECFAILTAREGAEPTVNLLAPVVVNPKNRFAVQCVQVDTEYSCRASLRPEGGR